MSSLDTLDKNVRDQGNGPLAAVTDENVLCLLENQYKELQLIRMHLEIITGETIKCGDINGS